MAAEPNISGMINKPRIALMNPKLISNLRFRFGSEYDGDAEYDADSDNVQNLYYIGRWNGELNKPYCRTYCQSCFY